jgi:hypothetical protein
VHKCFPHDLVSRSKGIDIITIPQQALNTIHKASASAATPTHEIEAQLRGVLDIAHGVVGCFRRAKRTRSLHQLLPRLVRLGRQQQIVNPQRDGVVPAKTPIRQFSNEKTCNSESGLETRREQLAERRHQVAGNGAAVPANKTKLLAFYPTFRV